MDKLDKRMSGSSISLQLLQSAVDAIEQAVHHVSESEPDIRYTSPTDLLPLSPVEEERVRNEETASNRERPELTAIQFCLMSSLAALAICQSLLEQRPNQTPFERERQWKKLASAAKTAGRAAYRAALALSDPAANG